MTYLHVVEASVEALAGVGALVVVVLGSKIGHHGRVLGSSRGCLAMVQRCKAVQWGQRMGQFAGQTSVCGPVRGSWVSVRVTANVSVQVTGYVSKWVLGECVEHCVGG
jgi:hypothetical protein